MTDRPSVDPAATFDAPGAVIETDALVIGAGPVGLFQVFQLGLHAIQAQVVDALPQPGGQPVALYPDKPIYDIPALPVVSGQALADALQRQAAPFAPRYHLGQRVQTLAPHGDGRWRLATDAGTSFVARCVFIAAGVGAFEPRRLRLDGLPALEGVSVFHHPPAPARWAGQRLVIVGDGDAALDAALRASDPHQGEAAASVLLVHRRDAFSATPERVAALRARVASGAMRFVVGQISGFEAQGPALRALTLTPPEGDDQRLPADRLLVLQGLSPRLGPIADWGLALERKLLPVSPETFATAAPGIFAVGDINHYPGKRKLIVCGFHEATLAAFAAAALLAGGQPVPLQYTTSSSRLHALLGVGTTAAPTADAG